MSSGPSLYRRHRPRTFADVVGQEHVVRTLSHAVERGNVHHAYLFVGSRGTGKTSMAKILAACLNCVDGPTITPCGVCDSCVSIASATSLDVIEMDAASNNSVDDIRELREKVAYAPVSGRHKVYILDEAHMLSQQAWNAFLKTLEEPPPRTIFVLATTEAQKVLPTVVDRCHRFDFGRPSAEQVASVVRRVSERESIDVDPGAAALISRHATGSFRDALGTLEQLVTYAGGERIQPADVLAVLGVADAEQLFGAVNAVIARDPAQALRAAAQLAASGRDPGQVLRDLEIHARELLTVRVLGEVPPELRVTADRDQRLAEQAQAISEPDAVRLLDLVSAALDATANGAQPRIQLELVLIKAAAPEVDPSVAALQARIERLEAGLATARPAVAHTVAMPQPAPEDPEPVADVSEPAEAAPQPAAAESHRPAAAVTPGGPVSGDLEAIAALWPAVVDTVRGGNAMLAALLQGARPVAVNERELTVAFSPEAAFMKRKAEQDDYRRAASEALRNVTGQALALRYELVAADDSAEAPVAVAEAPVSDDELIARFVQELDAQEIQEPDDKDL
ncbi:MAG TPA: DNA polymerase III subunit gamma/tau [Solirubrobacteraceae bacterium]|nr:DNA polymerase III subunit gamma/tau [Solirubrobacteraceae bacterium]